MSKTGERSEATKGVQTQSEKVNEAAKARRQLDADDQARQAQSHGPAWTSRQTVADTTEPPAK